MKRAGLLLALLLCAFSVYDHFALDGRTMQTVSDEAGREARVFNRGVASVTGRLAPSP
jgi:hypothetical protein